MRTLNDIKKLLLETPLNGKFSVFGDEELDLLDKAIEDLDIRINMCMPKNYKWTPEWPPNEEHFYVVINKPETDPLKKDFKHPVQPLYEDEHGTTRFKENYIVKHLIDNGPFDMNSIAMGDFSPEDREQFYQLIGYSLSGFGDLSHVSDSTYNRAAKQKVIKLGLKKAKVKKNK